ncbi:acyl carrier protein [Pseudonocardia sp. H11422]|uniref:acyl carrier protein n=1 Tax=Pseudonocardia sp. H11422 TaxID=2835866 RepID=UPI001BDD1DC1|nr:acyl carrier protein [Pseudonocardia sp. H11422]
MAAGETGFSDVVYDLVSVEYHALKGGYVYGQYARDAEDEGHQEIAEFFRQVMREDSARAEKCHRFLVQLSGTRAE